MKVTKDAGPCYLRWKPVTPKGQLGNFQTKKTGLCSEQTPAGQMLEFMNSECKMINDKMPCSLGNHAPHKQTYTIFNNNNLMGRNVEEGSRRHREEGLQSKGVRAQGNAQSGCSA